MATNAPGWELGETREPPMCNKVPAKAHSAISKGDFVQIRGGQNGAITVQTQITTAAPLGVALYSASAGEMTTILTYGLVVVQTATGATGVVAGNDQVRCHNGKLVKIDTASAGPIVGTIYGDGVRGGENVLILLSIGSLPG